MLIIELTEQRKTSHLTPKSGHQKVCLNCACRLVCICHSEACCGQVQLRQRTLESTGSCLKNVANEVRIQETNQEDSANSGYT